VGVLNPGTFVASQSILLFAVTLIGGPFSLFGAALAGLFMQAVPVVFDQLNIDSNLILVIFGLGLIHAIATNPIGVAGQLEAVVRGVGRRLGFGEGDD
jgi:branched-chain amino acid transport system permease protein